MGPASHSQRRVHIPARFSDRLFLAFRSREFRWLWASIAFSFIGRTVFIMAEGWLVLTITDSPFWVGAMAGIRGVTTLCVSPLAGVIADRVDRRMLLMYSYLLLALIAILLAYLTFTDLIRLWQIPFISFLYSAALTLSLPARWTLTMDLVGKGTLLNATAAIYMAASTMQIVSPTVGGVIISAAGIRGVYIMVGAGFLAASAAMWKTGPAPRVERQSESPWRNLKEGVSFIMSNPALRTLILMGLVTETFGWSYQTMLPVIARDVLKVGATGFGFLLTAGGVGSMVATLIVASLGDFKAKGRLLTGGCAGLGIFVIMFAASPWFPLSMFLLMVASAMGIFYDSMLATMLQTLSPDNMRGRVMSFYVLTYGMTPLGGFQAGAIAGFLGAPLAVAIGAAIVTLNALRMMRLVPRLQQK